MLWGHGQPKSGGGSAKSHPALLHSLLLTTSAYQQLALLGAGFEEDEEGSGAAGRRWDILSWVLAADQMFTFPSSTWS